MRLPVVALAVIGLMACGKVLYGEGELFVWNGTADNVEATIEGRSRATFVLAPRSGQRLGGALAGPYRVSVGREGAMREHEVTLAAGGTAIVNLDGAACFARMDIAGMYQSGKDRVRLLQAYGREATLSFDYGIPVLPGEPPPVTRPKSVFAFQRLIEIPCHLLGDDAGIVEYARKSR